MMSTSLFRPDQETPATYVEPPLDVVKVKNSSWRPPNTDTPTNVQKIGLRFEERVSEWLKYTYPNTCALQPVLDYQVADDPI
jgi:hypothetical protein